MADYLIYFCAQITGLILCFLVDDVRMEIACYFLKMEMSRVPNNLFVPLVSIFFKLNELTGQSIYYRGPKFIIVELFVTFLRAVLYSS